MKSSFAKLIAGVFLLAAMLLASPRQIFAHQPLAPLGDPLVTLSADNPARSGMPGSRITYRLTITNTGDASDTFALTSSGHLWSTALGNSNLTVDPGTPKTFNVEVIIPLDATNGASDGATIQALGTSGATHSIQLTTTAVIPTATPPSGISRPLLVVQSYSAGGTIESGKDFNLDVSVRNNGQAQASNIIISFESTDFLPLDTGGLRTVSSLVASNSVSVSQAFMAGPDTASKTIGMINATITYSDNAGNSYSDSFTLIINIKAPVYSGVVSATRTPTGMPRPQIMVSKYSTDVDPLQPGSIFNLSLEMRNLGNSEARAVTMILGGGNVEMSGGTPQPGTTGGSGDTSNFAPLGSSNLYYLGDIPAGGGFSGTQQLIVNVNTNPGAYPLKLSFVYNDVSGNRVVDDQVVTLLVYSLPQIEIGFYQETGIIMANQPAMLPLQITNLGRKSAILGNMKVTAPDAELTNNTSLIGTLEPGGYFTLDPLLTAMQAGPLELEISINYTDDFNQPRTITQTLSLVVEEAPEMDPFEDGMFPPEMPQQPETFLQKVVRFIKGLLGLDSAVPEPEIWPEMMPGEIYPEDAPPIKRPLG